MTAVKVARRTRPAPVRARTRDQIARVIAIVFLLDASMLTLAVPLAVTIKFGAGHWRPDGIQWLTGHPIIDFGWVVPLWLGTLVVQDAYSRRLFARGSDEFKTVIRGSVAAAFLTSMLAYLINYDMSRGFYLWVFLVGTVLLLAERYVVARIVARMRRDGRLMHRVVAVGGEAEVLALLKVLSKRAELGYEIVAACIPGGSDPCALGPPVVGTVDHAVETCETVGADSLLVAGGSLMSSADLRKIGWRLADGEIDMIVVPSLIDVAGPRIHMRPVSGLPFMHIEPPQVARAMKWGKAAFDRLGALLLLIVLSPVFLAVAAAIKIENVGPVFFRHQRVGATGQEFGVWKFRSMVTEAEELHAELVKASQQGALLFKVRTDPRVTRVGAFIRRYSLDELPQLINVLAGEMSLVGPRPQVPDEVAQYGEDDHRRLMVRPGLTGLWQVSGRSNLTWEESVRLDLCYVDNWSMAGDLVILFKTMRAVLRADGAY